MEEIQQHCSSVRILTGKNYLLAENSLPLALAPPQIPLGLNWDRTRFLLSHIADCDTEGFRKIQYSNLGISDREEPEMLTV